MKAILLSLVYMVALIGASSAYARGWAWADQKYAHYADNEPIQELLQQFASSVSIPIFISEKVQGTVSGKFEEAKAREFLDKLSRIHNLLWYYDGQVLYVYDSSEFETVLINMQGAAPDRLLGTLAQLGVLDSRFAFKANTNEGIVMVSGPPRYTELVREVADMILANKGESVGDEDSFVVRVFELRYAWADDRVVRVNGQVVVAPGVASTLRAVLGRDTPASTVVEEVVEERGLGTPTGLKGKGLVRERRNLDDQPGVESSDQSDKASGSGSSAYVVANDRMNAVIVHDRLSRIPLYQELIHTLDRPQHQVEIEVSIIDVSTDRLSEMGFEWQVNGSKGSIATDDFTETALPRDPSEISVVVGDNANFSTVLNSTQDFFLTRIKALSERGEANVLSRPTILTLDNNEAIIDLSTTFYVRLTGDREVDLFPVSVGSVLRVTPHIIQEPDRKQIHMDISIEDGQQTEQTVDGIPTISKSVINTQAVINEKASLLIGGYYYNQDASATSKIPLLGDLPILGHLFRTDGSQARRKARLFLISPKVVANQGALDMPLTPESIIEEFRRRHSFGGGSPWPGEYFPETH